MLPGTLRYAALKENLQQLKNQWKSDIHLLFLDFDGVFIIPRKEKKEFLERIAKLSQTYYLKTVITSTHRFDMNKCEQLLSAYGIHVIGRTELEGNDRNEQIYNYLKTHPFHHFVILDDLFLPQFQDYAVHCDFFTGFDETAYQKAVKILEQQIEEDKYNCAYR